MKQQVKLLTGKCCSSLVGDIKNSKTTQAYINAKRNFSLEYIDATPGITLPKEFSLQSPSQNSRSNFDYENSVSLHKNLMGIDVNIASDKRLWCGLTHDLFFEYSCERWIKGQSSYTERSIKERFHFEGKTAKTRLRNSISRLWWGAELTIDRSREGHDRYRLTEPYWRLQDAVQGLMERKFGLYPNLRREFLELLALNPQLNGKEIRLWLKAINAAGGVTLLPFLDSDEMLLLLKKLGTASGVTWSANTP